jgi:hypothetical protein
MNRRRERHGRRGEQAVERCRMRLGNLERDPLGRLSYRLCRLSTDNRFSGSVAHAQTRAERRANALMTWRCGSTSSRVRAQPGATLSLTAP